MESGWTTIFKATNLFESEVSRTPLSAALPHGAKNVQDYDSRTRLVWRKTWDYRAAAHLGHCADLLRTQQAGRFGQRPGRRDQECQGRDEGAPARALRPAVPSYGPEDALRAPSYHALRL